MEENKIDLIVGIGMILVAIGAIIWIINYVILEQLDLLYVLNSILIVIGLSFILVGMHILNMFGARKI